MSSEPSDAKRASRYRWSQGRQLIIPTDSRAAVVVLIVSVALWCAGLPRIDLEAVGEIGLVSVLPVTAFISLLLLVVGVVAHVFSGRLSGRVWKAYIVAFITFVHGTPALVYGTLRYPWGWKHAGVVDYIQRLGDIDPSAPTVGV